MTNKTTKPKIKVGFDLDGVLLNNPLGAVRPLLKFVRKNIFKKKSTGSYTPETKLEEFINFFYIKLSYFKMRGYKEIIRLVEEGKIEAHIITARHQTYSNEFYTSVGRLNKKGHFTTANYNSANEVPHKFKENSIKQLGLDVYVEDNFDVVQKLAESFPGKVYWLTNPVDRHISFPLKFNDLTGVALKLEELFNQT